jgi:hypothetical protein
VNKHDNADSNQHVLECTYIIVKEAYAILTGC